MSGRSQSQIVRRRTELQTLHYRPPGSAGRIPPSRAPRTSSCSRPSPVGRSQRRPGSCTRSSPAKSAGACCRHIEDKPATSPHRVPDTTTLQHAGILSAGNPERLFDAVSFGRPWSVREHSAGFPSPRTRLGRIEVAVLQGLVRCWRCDRRMQVAYSGGDGNVPRHLCSVGSIMHHTGHTCGSLSRAHGMPSAISVGGHGAPGTLPATTTERSSDATTDPTTLPTGGAGERDHLRGEWTPMNASAERRGRPRSPGRSVSPVL